MGFSMNLLNISNQFKNKNIIKCAINNLCCMSIFSENQ